MQLLITVIVSTNNLNVDFLFLTNILNRNEERTGFNSGIKETIPRL